MVLNEPSHQGSSLTTLQKQEIWLPLALLHRILEAHLSKPYPPPDWGHLDVVVAAMELSCTETTACTIQLALLPYLFIGVQLTAHCNVCHINTAVIIVCGFKVCNFYWFAKLHLVSTALLVEGLTLTFGWLGKLCLHPPTKPTIVTVMEIMRGVASCVTVEVCVDPSGKHRLQFHRL